MTDLELEIPGLKRRRVSHDDDDDEHHEEERARGGIRYGSSSPSSSSSPTSPSSARREALVARFMSGFTNTGPLASSSTSHTASQAIVRSTDLWFDDGSVVLQVEGVQYKVHRTVLARHSPIFQAVFEMPHPEGEPKVDGCPLLHLQDSAQDVKYMLLAFYDRGQNVRDPLPFDVVAAMIRMGRKYDIEYLRQEALLRLTMEFPTTLAEWDRLPQEYTQIHHQSGILFDIVNLAHENGIKSILPAAYYLCIQEFDDLLIGTARSDGSIAQVSWEVKRDCVLGRDRLLRAQAEHLFKWIDHIGTLDQCTQGARCRLAAAGFTKVLWVPMPEPARTLEKWHEFKQVAQMHMKDLCRSCEFYATMAHEDGRRTVWRNLPSYFGLESWKDLKNFDD